MKVVKFGGSSLADAAQFKKVAEIIHADKDRRYVVPSAPGKRFSDDIKVTDMLYVCYEKALRHENIDADFQKICDRYQGIIDELGLDLSLEQEFFYIKNSFMVRAGRDYAASRGEYLNGIILAKYLGFEFIDAADVIFFKENGSFDGPRSEQALQERLAKTSYAVIPGFYGSMPNDTIKTFSRGGSDFTGSVVASAVHASLYENWTDVSGFLIADPRIVKNPQTITTITYRELRELAYMGATVLHEDAIFPVSSAGIPINIKNTNRPEDPGTMIVKTSDEISPFYITGIAGKKGFSVIHVEKDRMNSEVGFGRRLLGVLERHNIPFEHLPSGIDTMSVVVSTHLIEGIRSQLIDQIQAETGSDIVQIDDGVALLAVVGRGMRKMIGTAARICAALAHARINLWMIDQGSSELNVIVGVNEMDFEKATQVIYEVFVDSVEQ